MKLNIEMYGLSPFTNLNHVELELREGATVPELFRELRSKVPSLAGRVIETGSDPLVDAYGLYVNGRVLDPYSQEKLNQGDRVVILLLAVGG